MAKDDGRPGGLSSQATEPQSVSAVPASIPDAYVFDQGMIAGLEMAAVILQECLADGYCESCKSPWKYDHQRDEYVSAFVKLREAGQRIDSACRRRTAQAIEARRAETGTGSVEDESAVAESDAPDNGSPSQPNPKGQ